MILNKDADRDTELSYEKLKEKMDTAIFRKSSELLRCVAPW